MAFYVRFNFTYPGTDHEEVFEYKIPYEVFVEGIRRYFEKNFFVTLDATDKDIWNMCIAISRTYGDEDQYCELFDLVEEDQQEFFREKLQEEAFEEFKQQYEDEYLAD